MVKCDTNDRCRTFQSCLLGNQQPGMHKSQNPKQENKKFTVDMEAKQRSRQQKRLRPRPQTQQAESERKGMNFCTQQRIESSRRF